MILRKTLAAVMVGGLISSTVSAAEPREEILKVKKSTFTNLVDLLVQRGVLDKKDAQGLITEAEAEAKAAESAQSAPPQAQGVPAPVGKDGKKSKYVGYVPEFVKQEIRDQVRAELKDDVLKDVKQTAKKERWGIPDALPDWITRINPYFDMRLRVADDFYQSTNAPAYDWMAINQAGGISQAMAKNQAFLNTTVDRLRLRERFRIGFDAQINESLKAGFRFATSNQYNPVSNNQTLGNTGQSWQFAIDRAFLQYDFNDQGNDWVTVWGGRMPNPFVSTDVVFDPDLSFEGFAGTFRWNFAPRPVATAYTSNTQSGPFGINMGPQHPNTVYATAGVFPIQEVNFSSRDKWLFGYQMGADWLYNDEVRFKLAGAYYDYDNISAKRNIYDSLEYNYTAPQFMQKGNTLVAINDAKNQPDCNTGTLGSQNVCLVGLASGFQIVNATATVDYARFAPIHVMLTGDYAKNLGFNKQKIMNQFGENLAAHTNAYQVRMDVGRPVIRQLLDWNMYFAYRYIEADAVLDAFTDSVFHQGGTDAKGWVLGAQVGLFTNAWMNLRWFSTDAINGPPLSIDTLTADFNARF
ncbi:putative porin [Methylomagnum ishizawai]|uniref:putative porin n=1 Tax=Methylomagnum ishizawai TaxID=1760988 RepID=UPI001C321E66|nr:putative porin [Methylomagnum ishizawai]BBL77064.1 hypothetical protein MishRS11D_41620 [Methylomagnum ishizawai]